MSHFKKIIESYKTSVSLNTTSAWELICSMECIFEEIELKDKAKFWEVMKDMHESIKGKHFDEVYAKYQVSCMYHTKTDGIVCRGEIIDIEESKRIHEQYRRHIDTETTIWDMYVALNAQHHDYSNVYKTWFTDDVIRKEKIVESAIIFWFKDEDHAKGKVWDYFDE